MSQLAYINISPDYACQVPTLQRICFPQTNAEVLFTEEDMLKHCEIFPQGTFMVLDGDRLVGLGAGIFLNFDFEHPQHTLHGIAGEHGVGNHNPKGEWYYGTDISVHPDYRRRGIGKRLYRLRKQVVRDHNKKGIIAGGVLPGFRKYLEEMSALDYVTRVVAGELYDPTLSFQIKNGFQVRGVLENYFNDQRSGSWASLIVWENPDYQVEA